MANSTVIFDANVLYPAPMRSILIYLATADLFRAHWTYEIHEEWIRNLLSKRPELTRELLEKHRDLMIRAIPDSIVQGYQHITSDLDLPDPDDRHVLAAAIKSKAEIIVTMNLKDFPDKRLQKYNIRAQHPDEFIANLFESDAKRVLSTFKADRNHYLNPPYSAEEYIDILRRQGLENTATILRDTVDVI